LFAVATLCVSFAASSAAAQDSALVKDGTARCGKPSARDADAPQGPQAASCDFRAEEDDRSYLLATASPGDTMTRQGPEVAIARLNPEFVARLADAIHEARDSGLPSAGIFSAYRPPGFGVGGFADKFNSLHSYGLAVDMSGIGEPGSKEAKLWHDIAGRHGISCPYGFESRTEWNHCQATPLKMVVADNPLRRTITADGPVALEEMFKVGQSVIDDPAAASLAVAADRPTESDAARPRLVHAALASERADQKHLHGDRTGPGGAAARAVARNKSKMLVVAMNTQHLDKSRRKAAAEPKTRVSRKAARTAAGHHEPPRHRSHLA
jgi:hypothetical protein